MNGVQPIPQIEIMPHRCREVPMGGVAHQYDFPNGYTASVVQGPYTYGGRSGLWEVAVLHGDVLCYDTPVTSDVIGHLTDAEVADVLAQIAALPPRRRWRGRK